MNSAGSSVLHSRPNPDGKVGNAGLAGLGSERPRPDQGRGRSRQSLASIFAVATGAAVTVTRSPVRAKL